MLTVEKTRVNAWNMAGLLITIIITAFGWGVTYNMIMSNSATNARQIDGLNNTMRDVQKQLPVIGTLQLQMTQSAAAIAENKANNKATNDRVDRIVEQFGDKLDMLNDKLTKTQTAVEVLSSQINYRNKSERITHSVGQSEKKMMIGTTALQTQ